MQRLNTIESVRHQVATWRAAGLKVGLVPTMGNLHSGHVRLAERALELCDRAVVSVFVNPTQFGENEDFDAYPRTLDGDEEALSAVCDESDVLFAPTVAEMYPGGDSVTTTVHVPELSVGLCGEARPGHFEGVATVVSRLFNIVQADVGVFGEKDFQQLLVIKRLARDLCFAIEVVGEPTVREVSGLAKSSRNRYLTANEKLEAPRLQMLLQETATALKQGGTDYAALEQQASDKLTANGWKPDYFEIRSADDLSAPTGDEKALVILGAGYLGAARLIDNLVVRL